jgi:hypothetical protein
MTFLSAAGFSPLPMSTNGKPVGGLDILFRKSMPTVANLLERASVIKA